jgi:uncharacterized protein (TIGR02996 family)
MKNEGFEALDRAVREAPDDDNAFLVFGDWLQARGDARGELVALQKALSSSQDDAQRAALRSAETALIRQTLEALVGDELAQHIDQLHLEWHLGFIRHAHLHGKPTAPRYQRSPEQRSPAELIEMLARCEAARYARSLTLGGWHFKPEDFHSSNPRQSGFDALLSTREQFPLLQTLSLFDDFEGVALARVSELSTLRALRLYGEFKGLDKLPERLETLQLHANLELQQSLVRLGQRELPETLGQLSVGLFSDPDVDSDDDEDEVNEKNTLLALAKLLDRAPRLRHLAIWGALDVRPFLEALPSTRRGAQLTALDLSYGQIGDEELALVASKTRLPALQTLILDGCQLGDQALDGLGRDDLQVFARGQRGPDLDWDPDRYRRQERGFYWFNLKLAASSEPDEAAHGYQMLTQSAGCGTALYNLGTYWMMGQRDTVQTAEQATLALKLALQSPHPVFIRQAWANVGILYANLGDYQSAIDIARRGLMAYPTDPNLYAILIDALRRSDQLEAALSEIPAAKATIEDNNESMACLQDCVETLLLAAVRSTSRALSLRWLASRKRPQPSCASGLHAGENDSVLSKTLTIGHGRGHGLAGG